MDFFLDETIFVLILHLKQSYSFCSNTHIYSHTTQYTHKVTAHYAICLFSLNLFAKDVYEFGWRGCRHFSFALSDVENDCEPLCRWLVRSHKTSKWVDFRREIKIERLYSANKTGIIQIRKKQGLEFIMVNCCGAVRCRMTIIFGQIAKHALQIS